MATKISPVTFLLVGWSLWGAPTLAAPGPEEKNTPPAVPLMMSDEGLRERQDHLLEMHALSNQILAAKDPKLREKLKDQQLQLMKDFELKHHQRMQQHLKEMAKTHPPAPAKDHD